MSTVVLRSVSVRSISPDMSPPASEWGLLHKTDTTRDKQAGPQGGGRRQDGQGHKPAIAATQLQRRQVRFDETLQSTRALLGLATTSPREFVAAMEALAFMPLNASRLLREEAGCSAAAVLRLDRESSAHRELPADGELPALGCAPLVFDLGVAAAASLPHGQLLAAKDVAALDAVAALADQPKRLTAELRALGLVGAQASSRTSLGARCAKWHSECVGRFEREGRLAPELATSECRCELACVPVVLEADNAHAQLHALLHACVGAVLITGEAERVFGSAGGRALLETAWTPRVEAARLRLSRCLRCLLLSVGALHVVREIYGAEAVLTRVLEGLVLANELLALALGRWHGLWSLRELAWMSRQFVLAVGVCRAQAAVWVGIAHQLPFLLLALDAAQTVPGPPTRTHCQYAPPSTT